MYQQPTLFNLNQYNAIPTRFREVQLGQRFQVAHYHAAEQRYSRSQRIYQKINQSTAQDTKSILQIGVDDTQQVFIVYGADE